MTIEEAINKYGQPLYIGSKHLIWKDTERDKAIKATRPGYLTDGSIIFTSQQWHEPADPDSPHPSTDEMQEFLRSHGFSQMQESDWQQTGGVIARNVKPSDFIRTKDAIIPIDIRLERLRSQ